VSAGTVTLANGTSPSMNVAGSMSLVAGTVWTSNLNVTFSSTTTGKVVTTNGVLIQSGNFIFNGVGGGWTLGSSLTLNNGNVQLLAGSFSTSATGYTITLPFGQLFLNTSSVRSIDLNSSTVFIGSAGLSIGSTTNLTFNAGTSQLNFSAYNGTFAGNGLTFYNVSFTGPAIENTITISGSNTFNNLTFSGPVSAGAAVISFSAGQTINGVWSTTSTAGNRRLVFGSGLSGSSQSGIAYTFTINGSTSLTDADFVDLYVIGTAAPISGTRLGNLGGTSGITFSAPKTVYWATAAGGNWQDNNWAATAGGAVNTNNFPLAQDTAAIVNTGLNTSAFINFTSPTQYMACSTVDMSARTNAMTINTSGYSPKVYGNWINGSGTTIAAGNGIYFVGRGTQTITSAGKSFGNQVLLFSGLGGTVQLADALISGGTISVGSCTFTTNGYAVTASALSSSNSSVRTINLGASTLTLSAATPIDFTTGTNLTFNAGTSTLSCSATNVQINSSTTGATGQTFYNVTLTNTALGTPQIYGALNTFNNITVTAPASTGFAQLLFSGNATINGTLTVAGATAVRRIFLRSDTQGTTRTLTVNSLSATDCDFRDITLAGAAAGSSPTRAGDCGNNTGITFPAPKTVYWNLAGFQSWSATGWCPSSGGTPDINQFPLAQDTAVFDNTGSVGAVLFNASWNIGTFDSSARTSAMTIGLEFSNVVSYGNWLFGTGVTPTNISGGLTFNKNGTQTITSNGVQFTFGVGANRGTLQLADAFSSTSSLSFGGSNTIFDAVSYNVTCFSVTNNNSSCTIKMGSGTWTITGTSAIWSFGTAPTVYCGTANIVLSNNTTSSRTFNGGGRVYNKLTIGGATSTSTTTFANSDIFSELASTKTVAHTIALSSSTFGAWTVTGTAGNVVTISGTATITIAGARVSGVDYLALGTTTVSTTSPGEFYAGANSTGGTGFILTAAPTPVTRYWRGGSGTWDATTTTNWSDTSGGLGGFSVPTSVDTVIFDSLSNATGYTVTCTATQLRCGAITFSGPLTGNVTWAGTAPLAVHGNFTLPATGITLTYSGQITLSGSSTGKTITTNGTSLAGILVINGLGCGWTLGSACTVNGSEFNLTAGSFDTAGYSFTLSQFAATGFRSTSGLNRTLSLGASAFSFPTATIDSTPNFVFNKGTSTITITANSPQIQIIAGGSAIDFYNITVTSSSPSTSVTFPALTANVITIPQINSGTSRSLIFRGNCTINTLTLSASTNATLRTTVRSDTAGTTRTLSIGTFTAGATDWDFQDIAVTGAAAPISGTRFGDLKGNSGITFDAAKTVYWNLIGNQFWSATAWATSSGGTPAVNNFPLAQDTAVFDNVANNPGTVTVNAAWNIGTINMSARTNAMTLNINNAPSIYGNWITGTGVTYSGISNVTFAGKTTQTFTSSGRTVTFLITIDSIGGSLSLQDAFTSTYNIILTNGTFNSNGYSVSLNAFSSSNSNVRTLAFGSGSIWTITGNTTCWDASTSTNLTITGTGTISLTYATVKTFAGSVSYSGITLNQGGAGQLNITGNNTFYDITNTYSTTGATSIEISSTTQNLTQFTASGAAGKLFSIKTFNINSVGTLIVTGATKPTVDYLSILFVRGFPTTDFLYIGYNSVNLGSYGFIFSTIPITAAITGVLASGFVDSILASPQPQLSSASGVGNLGSLSVESYRALLGALANGQVDVFVPRNNVNANSVAASGVLGTATGEAQYFRAITGSGSVGNAGSFDLGTLSVDISGLAASGVSGVATASSNLAITSNAASGAVGNLTVSLLSELSSASADGLLGALASNRSVAIVGVPASAIPGTMTGAALYFAAITGTVSTGAVGSTTLGPKLIPITGNAASGNVGIVWCWATIDDDQNPNWTPISTTS
jgi:hypothetical protein